tara:strand:+ start:574 stop:696 length:123 start_codon:yes stop_codon:yes gene_type:complete
MKYFSSVLNAEITEDEKDIKSKDFYTAYEIWLDQKEEKYD